MKMFSPGSDKLFEVFFREHYPRYCYHANLIVEDKDMAEDVVQEAFAGLWEKWDEFDDESSAKAWLYTVVWHKALNQLRHEKVKLKSRPYLASDEVDDRDYLNDLIKAELFGQIHQAIESLPEGCRNIFKLSYFEGLKNQEIADALQLSVNTIKTQKARALQLLRLKFDLSQFALFLAWVHWQTGYHS